MDSVRDAFREHNIDYIDSEQGLLCRLSHIARALGLKNPARSVGNAHKRLVTTQTAGGPQTATFVTVDAVKQILCSTRSIKAPELALALGMSVVDTHFVCVESSVSRFLCDVFDDHEAVPQFYVDKYRIDLYFPQRKVAVECDELGAHGPGRVSEDAERQQWIAERLGCAFIRFRPSDPSFKLSHVVRDCRRALGG